MGKISQGILGGFSGTVGTVVGGNWRGIDYMRSRSTKRSSKPRSQKQLDQQAKFGMVSKFAYSISDLLDISFKDYAVKKTGTNSAMSYLLQEAVTGSSPNFSLDYSKVLISRGKLTGALNAAVNTSAAGRLVFTWTNNAGSGTAKANDRAIIVVYCPSLKQSVYTTLGATRSSGSLTMDVPFSGEQVHTYLGFLSEYGQEVATSVYAGMLRVS